MAESWVAALITLTAMEIVLGIDNIIFIAIVASRLPPGQQPRARRLGLMAALATRLLLLFFLSYLMGFDQTNLFTLPAMPFFETAEAREITLRDVILIAGGLFLIGKSTFEIHEKLEGGEAEERVHVERIPPSFVGVLVQIAVIDVVFSLDSVITAIGMARDIEVMVAAMVMAVGTMLLLAEPISRFVYRHPTLKMLALSFLILIGVLLVAEGLGQHLDRGYVYFAMAFSVVVELLNLRVRGRREPVHLKQTKLPEGVPPPAADVTAPQG